jgi:GTP cyclohydrolase II
MTGDVFGSRKCDCGEQLNNALSMIVKEKAGILIYSRQEGRGIGLFNKIRAYELQDQGRDTIQANEDLGLPVDGRTYQPAAAMLRYLKVTKIRLITNNPAKAESLRALKIDVVSTVGNVIPPHPENKDYLKIKELKMRHNFNSLVIPPTSYLDEFKKPQKEDSQTSAESPSTSSPSITSTTKDNNSSSSVPVRRDIVSSTSISSSSSLSSEAPMGMGRTCKKRCNSDLDCYNESAKIQAV